jgi:sec-independent protein translocase protein TatC
VAFALSKRGPSKFDRAADGSMTLIEHIRELRTRLFRASLGILAGLIVGLIVASRVQDFINAPYCDFKNLDPCRFNITSPVDPFLLNLKIGLYVGLVLGAPVWLYQLWAFVAPGLHRHERRYSYIFVAIAAPLFAAGSFLAFFVVSKSLIFFMQMADGYDLQVDLTGYFSFVTGVMLLFGAAFEFPLMLFMLNVAGILSARRMLGWWRVAIFLMFVFAAIVTPTPDPFGMTALAGAMSVLYFAAVGAAFVNDKRRGRGKEIYAGLDDDEISPLSHDPEPVEAGERTDRIEPVAAPAPLERRYDDMT